MREFNISTAVATVLNQSCTLVLINPKAAPNMGVEVLRWWVSQNGSTTSAQNRVMIGIKASAYPTLGALTPQTLKLQDPNASVLVGSTTGVAGTSGVNSSNENGGAYTVISQDAYNVLNGWLMVPTPAETIIAPASYASALIMQQPAAPPATGSWSFGCQFREI